MKKVLLCAIHTAAISALCFTSFYSLKHCDCELTDEIKKKIKEAKEDVSNLVKE